MQRFDASTMTLTDPPQRAQTSMSILRIPDQACH
jgi:hypothetical protein